MNQKNNTKLQKIALETAQRLLDYGSYGVNESNAIRAMKKRISGFTQEEYRACFDEAVIIHKDAIEYVEGRCDVFFKNYKEKSDGSRVEKIAENFVKKYPSYQPADLIQQLAFVFYIHHLR